MDEKLSTTVLTNHLILQKLFSHLSVEDLKSCRLACWKWEGIFTPPLIKSCVCSIRNTRSINRDLQLFHKVFPDPNSFQFSKFRLEGQFVAEHLEEFFKDREFIKELTVTGLNPTDKEGKCYLSTYNISSWTESFLEVLEIVLSSHNTTEIIVPLSYVVKIKRLILSNVTVDFDAPIAPIHLEVSSVRCRVDGQLIPGHNPQTAANYVLDLNKYIDATNLKELKLFRTQDLTFRLDLRECVRLEYLSLYTAHLVGWHKNLVLKTLHIGFVALNLSNLLPSVEELNVEPGGETFLTYSPTDSFPYIKSLRVRDEALIRQCPNLIRACMWNHFDLNSLPDTVRTVSIVEGAEFVGAKCLNLEKLVLNYEIIGGNYWNRIERIIDRFNPKILVLDNDSTHSDSYDELACGFDGLFRIVEKQMNQGGTCILKRVHCAYKYFRFFEIPIFETRPPFPMESGDYNLCTKGFGKSIEKSDFEQWINGY